jgi:hypothetical protein
MARERRAIGNSILKKKEMVERAIIRIIHNKIMEFTNRRMYIWAKGKYHHFHAPQYRKCLRRGTKYSLVHGGKYGNGKNIPFFFPPLIFLQVFLSQVGKKLDQGGKYYFVSPQAHIPEAV